MSHSNLSRRSVLRFPALAGGLFLAEPARSRVSRGGSTEWERRTYAALERYRILATEDDGEPLPPAEGAIAPRARYAGGPRLTRLLRLLGDLPGDPDPADPVADEDELTPAVQRFQSRHGLEANGIIDQATQDALNTPLAVRVRQLELALDQWSHLSYDPSRPAVVLNLPEYRLRAYSEGGRLDLEMKIIIGEAPDRKTPDFSSHLECVILRPYWNVPLSIQRDELIPEILKDASFLSANHLQVLAPNGDLVDGAAGLQIEQLRTGRLRLRQAPGEHNVLGLAKFEFPNEYGIYMHGTSAPWLFAKARRDFSHGCIRVQQVEDLAEWLLRRQPGWKRDRIVQTMHSSRSIAVKINPPVQLATVYVTAVALENGKILFLEDVYGEEDGKIGLE